MDKRQTNILYYKILRLGIDPKYLIETYSADMKRITPPHIEFLKEHYCHDYNKY